MNTDYLLIHKTANNLSEISGSHRSIYEDSSLRGCYAVSTDVLKKHSAFIMSNVPKLTKRQYQLK